MNPIGIAFLVLAAAGIGTNTYAAVTGRSPGSSRRVSQQGRIISAAVAALFAVFIIVTLVVWAAA